MSNYLTKRNIEIFENYFNGQTLEQAGNGLSVERTGQIIRNIAREIHLRFVRSGRGFTNHDWRCRKLKLDSENWIRRLSEYKNEDR